MQNQPYPEAGVWDCPALTDRLRILEPAKRGQTVIHEPAPHPRPRMVIGRRIRDTIMDLGGDLGRSL
jgi:hypothetical protein